MKYELDAIDRALLANLQRDASASYADLGRAVGLSVSAVNERVRKLEAKGALTGYTVRVNPVALDRGLLAFVQVSLNDPQREPAFLKSVTASPAVLECHTVTGSYSYLLKVRCRDTGHLHELLSGVIKATPGITRTETLIALASLKETAEVDCKKI